MEMKQILNNGVFTVGYTYCGRNAIAAITGNYSRENL